MINSSMGTTKRQQETFGRIILVALSMMLFLIYQCEYNPPALHIGTEKNNNRTKRCPQEAMNTTRRPVVEFIPFPYRTLGSGDTMQCQWTTLELDDDDNEQKDCLETRHGYDRIQRATYEEGFCMPNSTASLPPIHVFSTEEAISCLTQGNSTVSIYISGDSYNKQLFVGLADILLSRPNNTQIINFTMRNKVVNATREELLRKKVEVYQTFNRLFPTVDYVCEKECYGKSPDFVFECSRCINSYHANLNSQKQQQNTSSQLQEGGVVTVIGSAVHLLNNMTIPNALNVTHEFLSSLANGTIYNSLPAIQLNKVPKEYLNATKKGGKGRFYNKTLWDLAPQNPIHPFIDYYQLTKSCVWENCSYDGGHRSRFVNRWKAQLLLNTICRVVP